MTAPARVAAASDVLQLFWVGALSALQLFVESSFYGKLRRLAAVGYTIAHFSDGYATQARGVGVCWQSLVAQG